MRSSLVLAFVGVACSSPPQTGGEGGGGGGFMMTAGGAGGASGGTSGGAAGGSEVDAGYGWQALPALPVARQETGVVALGGKIYVVGGFVGTTAVGTVEAYDPATREWVDAGTLPLALHHANVAVVNGKLYVVGGLTGLGFVANRAVYEYDPGTRAWAAKAQLPLGTERGGSAVGVSNGLIYLAGGYRQGASVADFTTYDPSSDQHRSLPALPKARDHLVGGVVGSTFFAIGGRKDNVIDGRVDRYDLLDGGWSAAAPMLTARAGSAAGIYGSRIIVAGGEGNGAVSSGVFPQTEIYDSVNDRWADAGVMLTPRHGTGGAVVGDTFYLPGGATLQGFGATSTVEAYRFGGP